MVTSAYRSALFVVAAAVAVVAGCKDGASSSESPSPSSRVNAVAAAPAKAVDLDSFCDVRRVGGDAPTFALPELAKPFSGALSGGWHWVNVWATWCKPCMDEMRMLVQWRGEMDNFRLAFLSIDESDDDFDSFWRNNSNRPYADGNVSPTDKAMAELRIKSTDAVADWVTSLGLDSGATIPIHIFVDPHNKIRCVRSGALHGDDRAAVAAILAL